MRVCVHACVCTCVRVCVRECTWERGHSLARALWFMSFSSSLSAFLTVEWLHCSAGRSSSFGQLHTGAPRGESRPHALRLYLLTTCCVSAQRLLFMKIRHCSGRKGVRGVPLVVWLRRKSNRKKKNETNHTLVGINKMLSKAFSNQIVC